MNITEWPQAERPREKLLSRGAAALSDAELLAIFIRCGIKGKTAVDLSRELLQQFGDIKTLLDLEYQEFCHCCGLGIAKYVELQAALELARRYVAQTMSYTDVIKNIEAAKLYCLTKLCQCKREVFAVVFLDNNHNLLHYEELFYGTINRAAVYPREIIRRVLKYNATAVILLHNHVVGTAMPSDGDKEVTEELQKALNFVDVKILDHIIVGNG